jgi:hypothetical protein
MLVVVRPLTGLTYGVGGLAPGVSHGVWPGWVPCVHVLTAYMRLAMDVSHLETCPSAVAAVAQNVVLHPLCTSHVQNLLDRRSQL